MNGNYLGSPDHRRRHSFHCSCIIHLDRADILQHSTRYINPPRRNRHRAPDQHEVEGQKARGKDSLWPFSD